MSMTGMWSCRRLCTKWRTFIEKRRMVRYASSKFDTCVFSLVGGANLMHTFSFSDTVLTMFWLLEDCTLPNPITSVILKPFIVYSTIICKCYQTGQTRIRCWIISDRRIKTGKNFAGWITCICETHAKWKHAGSVWFKKFALKEKDIVQYAEVSLRGGSR